MARHCMRPGCDRPAAARLTYDVRAAAVWLDRPADDGEPAQQVCGEHASTLTAPLGWTVTDRRSLDAGGARGDGELAREGSASPFEADREARPAGVDVSGERLEARPGRREAEEVDPDVSEEPAAATAGATRDADPGTRGKLLDRAFEWTGPQHSVLTAGRGPRPGRGRG